MVEIQKWQTKKLSKEEELSLAHIIQDGIKAENEFSLKGYSDTLNLSEPSRSEKRKLEYRIAKGEEALSTLVRANINLVVSISMKYKEYYPYASDLEECAQEGLSGLIIAARKYDPDQGNKFSTMAFMWVRQSISRGVNSGGKLVRLPENRVEEYTKITSLERKILASNEHASRDEIDEQILAKFPRLTKEYLYSIRNAASEHYSLNRKVDSDDDNSAELMDVISQTSFDSSAEYILIASEQQDKLDECMGVLSPIQRDVITSSFGISGNGHDAVMSDKDARRKHNLKVQEYKEHLKSGLKVLRKELDSRGLDMMDFVS